MKAGAYVGVSGPTTREQVQGIVALIPPGMLVAIGLLASKKTIEGGECNARSPKPADIPGLWPDHPSVLRMLHYFTKDRADLAQQLGRAMSAAGARCDGIQINIAWPDVDAVARLRDRFPRARIVLQLGPSAIAEMRGHGDKIAARVLTYFPCIDDVLVDVSGGLGLSIDVVGAYELLAPLAMLRQEKTGFGLGIAGSLGSDVSIQLIAPLLRAFAPLSTDSETRMRTAKDEFDLERVLPYFDAMSSAKP